MRFKLEGEKEKETARQGGETQEQEVGEIEADWRGVQGPNLAHRKDLQKLPRLPSRAPARGFVNPHPQPQSTRRNLPIKPNHHPQSGEMEGD